MSSNKKVYTSESVRKANAKFMLRHHSKAPPKPIRKINVDPAQAGQDKTVTKVLSKDQTMIGDE